MLELKIHDSYTDAFRVMHHETEAPSLEARLAINLVERWALIACIPDGEDTAGRQKIRLGTPEELAARACDTAGALVAEIRARDWMTNVPTVREIEAKLKAEREAKKAKVDA